MSQDKGLTGNKSEKERHFFSTDWLALVSEKVKGLKFGTLQITVHEGQVTRIECIEKFRVYVPAGEEK